MQSVSLVLTNHQARSAIATVAIGSFLARRLSPERIGRRLDEIRHASDVIADLTAAELTISDESVRKVQAASPSIDSNFIESARGTAASILRVGDIGLHSFRAALAIFEFDAETQKGGDA